MPASPLLRSASEGLMFLADCVVIIMQAVRSARNVMRSSLHVTVARGLAASVNGPHPRTWLIDASPHTPSSDTENPPAANTRTRPWP
jgi:hypothetical protein